MPPAAALQAAAAALAAAAAVHGARGAVLGNHSFKEPRVCMHNYCIDGWGLPGAHARFQRLKAVARPIAPARGAIVGVGATPAAAAAAGGPGGGTFVEKSCCKSCDAVSECSTSRGELDTLVHHILPHVIEPAGGMRQSEWWPPVFLEAGGNNGIHASNTMWLEQCAGWPGILVEAVPNSFHVLTRHRPGALAVGQALCEERGHVVFKKVRKPTDPMAEIDRKGGVRLEAGEESVACTPMRDVLDATGVTHLTFFSLDVEGYELHVLEGIDWSRLRVGVMVVEALLDAGKAKLEDEAKVEAVHKHLTQVAGLRKVGRVCVRDSRICDDYYVDPTFIDAAAAEAALATHATVKVKWWKKCRY